MKKVRIGRRVVALVGAKADDGYVKRLHNGAESSFDHLCAALLHDPRGIALDIGANIGLTATILSQHFAAGTVYAFEPAPGVYAALETNVRVNAMSNVEAINRAVNDHGGEVRFEENSAYGHISSTGGTVVPAITVDEFVASRNLARVDFIKIDVEGFEKWVLLGARETLRRFNPLIYIEFNSWCLTAHTEENPIAFAGWLMAEFSYVYLVQDGALQRMTDPATLAHQNMALDGCVSDLILSNHEIPSERVPARRSSMLKALLRRAANSAAARLAR